MNKGFTIIEVLISLVILSIITLITSNILKSSLDTEYQTTNHLNKIKDINLSSSKIRRDLRQIVNVTSHDFYGSNMPGSFVSDSGTNSIIFNSNIRSVGKDASPIKRIEYLYENNQIKRRQYFSSNPYDQNQYIESSILTNIEELNFSFLSSSNWHSFWPINKASSKKIPKLIKIEFILDKKPYTWIIEPNISYASPN